MFLVGLSRSTMHKIQISNIRISSKRALVAVLHKFYAVYFKCVKNTKQKNAKNKV
jgi:hypothetical protein